MSRLLVHVRASLIFNTRSFSLQLVEQLLRDLFYLLVLLNFLHNLIVFLGQLSSLTLNNLPNLLLLFFCQTNLTLIKKSAHELATLNLLAQLPFANVKKFIALLSNDCVITFLSFHLFLSGCLLVLSSPRLFLNHPIHGDVHGLRSV